MISIRAATARDCREIAEIWNREIRDGVSTFNSVEKTLEEIGRVIAREDGFFCIAEERGAILGFASYAQFRGGIGYAHTMEHTIHLDAAARGRSTGRTLLEHLERHARQNGVHSLIAGVSGENTGGIAFHAALGYRQVGRVPQAGRKFGRWMDLVLMQKIL